MTTTTGTARVERDRDRPESVTLYVNGVPSSHLDLTDPGFLAFEYMQQMAAVIDQLPPGPLRVLHLGAGGCTLARWVEHTRPGSRQVGVDVDEQLLVLVRGWFDLPRSPRLRLRSGEAGEVLGTLAPAAFDVVVRDVFAGDTTPDHLVSQDAGRSVRRVLRPGGTYLVNCADRPPLHRARGEVATLRATVAATETTDGPDVEDPRDAADRVALVAEPAQLKGRRYGNVVLVAVRPGGATGDDAVPDLGAPSLARALRSLPLPARILTGSELSSFVGSTGPFGLPHDADR
ncbi:fused MFS/spermidine synthase [Cellulosimicrobium arenosum]|uniref:spermidine synthase n=1 Tax=Cellulosimicrobium arenosum TaxID=2708133 RepID=UPI0030CA4634